VRERAANRAVAVCSTSRGVISTGSSWDFAWHTGGVVGVQTTCIDMHIACFITTKAIKRGSSKSERI